MSHRPTTTEILSSETLLATVAHLVRREQMRIWVTLPRRAGVVAQARGAAHRADVRAAAQLTAGCAVVLFTPAEEC
jgi:hypothetical protein